MLVKEIELYNKWYKIFYDTVEEYSKLSEFRIKKLAGENARYLLSNFVNTNMIYTTSLRQINNIASFMKNL